MPEYSISQLDKCVAVIHVPHSSKVIPPDLRDQFVLTQPEIERELQWMTDRYADELFAMPRGLATRVIFPVSRLVVDPERFEDDDEEPMATKGMGVIYTRTSHGKQLRRDISALERKDLLQKFYHPHHERLAAAVGEALESHGRCLIIDAHSFPSAPLPYEDDQRADRPAMCIGTDGYHTPRSLADAAAGLFEREFDSVEFNRPFGGALVPAALYQKDARVHSIMIEINRSLYMNERTGERLPNFGQVAAKVRASVAMIINS